MGLECSAVNLPPVWTLDRWSPEYLQAWYNGDIDDERLGRFVPVFKPKPNPHRPKPDPPR